MTEIKERCGRPSSAPPAVNIDQWPVVVLTCPSEVTAPWVTSTLREMDAIFDIKEPFAVVVNAHAVTVVPTPTMRRLIAEWQASRALTVTRYYTGYAIVTKSRAVRFAVSALLWLTPPQVPYTFVDTIGEGIDWCRGCLRRARQ
jgi:hypothetical protein